MAHLLIFGERPERIAQGRSFYMSHQSNLLKVALLIWATWVIPSQLLICLERYEWITHSRSFAFSEMSKWANEGWVNERMSDEGMSEFPALFVIYLFKFFAWEQLKIGMN